MKHAIYFVFYVAVLAALVTAGCSKKTTKVSEQPSVETEQPKPVPEQKAPEKKIEPKKEAESKVALSFQTVYFDFDNYNIRSDQRDVLANNASVLEAYPDVRVLIIGNCDERGTIEYNLALGDKRANTVKEYLQNYGISGNRLSTLSYGEEQPADPGHNEAAWAKNRRAEFKIVQK